MTWCRTSMDCEVTDPVCSVKNIKNIDLKKVIRRFNKLKQYLTRVTVELESSLNMNKLLVLRIV